MILQEEEKKEGEGKVWNAWMYSPPNGKRSSDETEIRFRSGPATGRNRPSHPDVYGSPQPRHCPRPQTPRPGEGQWLDPPPQWRGLLDNPAQTQRQRGASPGGAQRPPRPETRSCRVLSFRRVCPLRPVLPKSKAAPQSRWRWLQHYDANLGSLFLLQCPSLVATASNLSPSSSAADSNSQPSSWHLHDV